MFPLLRIKNKIISRKIRFNDFLNTFRLLLGSVNHALKFERSEIVVCQPIPLEASCHIADHIQVTNIALENEPYIIFREMVSNPN